MKLLILTTILSLPLCLFAKDVTIKACDNEKPNITAEVTVHSDEKSGRESIDLTAQNFAVDPKLLTQTKNMQVVMKLAVSKDELGKDLIHFYDLKGVTKIISEIEYAALPIDGLAAFMVNVITQSEGAMGINVGIQAGGATQVDTDLSIKLAFVGSSLNCK